MKPNDDLKILTAQQIDALRARPSDEDDDDDHAAMDLTAVARAYRRLHADLGAEPGFVAANDAKRLPPAITMRWTEHGHLYAIAEEEGMGLHVVAQARYDAAEQLAIHLPLSVLPLVVAAAQRVLAAEGPPEPKRT